MNNEVTNTMIENFLTAIGDDYARWTGAGDSKYADTVDARNAYFREKLEFSVGKKYIKIISDRAVHSFIVIAHDKKFPIGTILKAAGWQAPARNFARGNVITENYNNVAWTGA